MYEADRLPQTFDDLERVGKIFRIKITTQFSGRNSVVGDILRLDQLFFHAGVRTDIRNLIAGFLQMREQSNIRCHMTGSTTAGKQYFLHRKTKPSFVTLI